MNLGESLRNRWEAGTNGYMPQTFGALLKQVRGAGRSQSDVAAIIAEKTQYRPSQQNIGRWERGEGVEGGIRQELEMLDALGVPPRVAVRSLIGDLLDEVVPAVSVPVAINLDRRLSDDERREVRLAIGHHLRGRDTPEYRPLKAVAPVRIRSGLHRIS